MHTTHKRGLAAVMLCVALAALTGCPPQAPPQAGAWEVSLDEDCDQSILGHLGFVLDPNGTARAYLSVDVLSGTWSTSNGTITITMVQPVLLTFTGTLSPDGNSVTSGNFVGSLNGCWTAERIEF